MAVVTTITPEEIAVAMGMDTPPSGSITDQQWSMWINDAVMLIDLRAAELDVPGIDQAKVDYVVREAVVAHARRPDDSTQVTRTVDDASVSRTYRSGPGRVSILDEWWALLGLTGRRGRAFEIDTAPEGMGVHGVDYWWPTTTDWAPLP